MRKLVSRRFFLGGAGAFALLTTPACANPPDVSLRPVPRGTQGGAPAQDTVASGGSQARGRAAELIAQAGLSGVVTFAVADARSGQILETHEPARSLPPASVAKAITTLYALDRLGAQHRFATRLLATGPVTGGVLRGDLILAGGGDPTLDTDRLGDLARQLKARGISTIDGRFLVWDGALPYARQIDADQPDHVGYNPALSGIALNYNRVHFEWRREGTGWSTSMDARSDTQRPAVRGARMSIAARDLPIYTYENRAGIDHWTVAQPALGKGGARWLPVRQPGLYAAEVLRVLARAQGVTLPAEQKTGALPQGTIELARHTSVALQEILRDMLRHSTNITAEMIGMAASAAGGSAPASLRASARAMSVWAEARLGMRGVDLVDHSGLSDASRVSAPAMTQAMLAAGRDNRLRPILREFALRDARGNVIKSHPIRVDAKTGTLNFVSGLGGYMTAPGGRDLAFTIIVADLATRKGIPRAAREAPKGAAPWNRKAKSLQQALIEHWGATYGS